MSDPSVYVSRRTKWRGVKQTDVVSCTTDGDDVCPVQQITTGITYCVATTVRLRLCLPLGWV